MGAKTVYLVSLFDDGEINQKHRERCKLLKLCVRQSSEYSISERERKYNLRNYKPVNPSSISMPSLFIAFAPVLN